MACKCRNKQSNAPQAKLETEELFTTIIIEVNLVGRFDRWWMNIGVTRHVSFDRVMFKTYIASQDQKVLLGDFHPTNVALKMDLTRTIQ